MKSRKADAMLLGPGTDRPGRPAGPGDSRGGLLTSRIGTCGPDARERPRARHSD
jgi:hypothetical protein